MNLIKMPEDINHPRRRPPEGPFFAVRITVRRCVGLYGLART
jgi:hypothetical protein